MAEEKKEGIEGSQSTPDDKAAEVDVTAEIEKAKEEARAEALKAKPNQRHCE